MNIRIIDIASENVDIIFDEQVSTAVENHKLLPRKLLQEYQEDWLNFVDRVLAEKNSRPSDNAFDEEVASKLGRYGKTLQNMLIPAGFNISKADKLIFSVDPNWVRLPFELLPTGNESHGFAGLKIPILRQIRTVRVVTGEVNKPKKHGRQFLLLANPAGSLDLSTIADAEKKSLENISGGAMQLKGLGKLATTAQIIEELVHCNYLHYSGHVREQSLQFKQGVMSSSEIAAFNLENLELAFINGCNSASTHDANSLVQAFLSAGAKNYIGYNHLISDQVALFAADFVWRNLFEPAGILKNLSSIFGYRQKALSEIALLLRRAIFKKFGAAELAWLNIQFFSNSERRSKRSSLRLLPAAMATGIALLLAAILWKSIWQPIKLPGEGIPKKALGFKSETDRKLKQSLSPKAGIAYQEPSMPELKPRIESLPPIDSPVLADLIASFRGTQHPFYTREDKERILSEVLNMSVSESAKIIRLRNEMP